MTEGAHAALRAATRAEHERLDTMMGGFDLADRAGYRSFLAAHAMALPAVEAALDRAGFADRFGDWPERRRATALADDLAALGDAMPAPLDPPVLTQAAAQWGAAYVVEGSRLGGKFLARQVGEGLPISYLGAAQPSGAWRQFLGGLDGALTTPQDIATAQAAARAVFAMFETAAARQMDAV
jgi:heme oxygenase